MLLALRVVADGGLATSRRSNCRNMRQDSPIELLPKSTDPHALDSERAYAMDLFRGETFVWQIRILHRLEPT